MANICGIKKKTDRALRIRGFSCSLIKSRDGFTLAMKKIWGDELPSWLTRQPNFGRRQRCNSILHARARSNRRCVAGATVFKAAWRQVQGYLVHRPVMPAQAQPTVAMPFLNHKRPCPISSLIYQRKPPARLGEAEMTLRVLINATALLPSSSVRQLS